MTQFVGNDYGVFVFGRSILAKSPAVCLTFFYKVDAPAGAETITASDGAPQSLPESTGVMFDHHRADIVEKYQNQPLFPTQALHHLANEGLADSVEFRRLARKFIRRAKQHNLKHLFFPEAIFAEPRTQQILQHLAGSQLKIKTLELPDTYHIPHTTDQRSLTIYHDLDDISFLKKRAETLLGTKLKAADFKTLK